MRCFAARVKASEDQQMNLSSNALVTIRSSQLGESGPDSLEMMVGGLYEFSPGGCRLNYNEVDPDDGSKTSTELTTSPDSRVVTVSRTGEISTHMVFEQGKRHVVYYDTRYGSLLVGISTHRLSADVGEEGGKIAVEYAVEIDSAVANEIKLEIDISRSNMRS